MNDLKNAEGVETLTIRMEAGEENTTHHFLPKRKNGKLVVLQHGHGCTFDDGTSPTSYGLANAIDTLLGEGYGVLAAYMPHMRPNDCRTVPHAQMFDIPVKSGNQLKFFLEPVAISLNYLKPRYKEVHMAGLSGGGWTTTLYAAVDPSIRYSFPVAGASRSICEREARLATKSNTWKSFTGLPVIPICTCWERTVAGASKCRS